MDCVWQVHTDAKKAEIEATQAELEQEKSILKDKDTSVMNVQSRVGSLKKSLKDTDDNLESHAANCKLALALVSTPK